MKNLAILILFLTACTSGNYDSKKSAVSQKDQWYAGGTLHKASIAEWKSANRKNKLATCAHFVANVKKLNGESYKDFSETGNAIKDAEKMLTCLDGAVSADTENYKGMKIGEVAASCAILMGM